MSLQFSSVGEANIGSDFILLCYILLSSWVIGGSVRVVSVLGVCIPGFQIHFNSFICLFLSFYYVSLSGGTLSFLKSGCWAAVQQIMYSQILLIDLVDHEQDTEE